MHHAKNQHTDTYWVDDKVFSRGLEKVVEQAIEIERSGEVLYLSLSTSLTEDGEYLFTLRADS